MERAPGAPSASRFYQLADIALPIQPGGLFDKRIRAGLSSPPACGIWAITTRGTPLRTKFLTRYDLTVDPSRPCVTIKGVVPNTAIEVCPLMTSKT